jgi:hypothetical protein
MIRAFSLSDLASLEKDALFPLDNIRNKRVLLQGSMENDGKLIGLFIINQTAEMSLILSNNASPRERLLAIREMAPLAKDELEARGISEVHAFVNDPKFANLIVQHFGFEHCLGRSLVYRS